MNENTLWANLERLAREEPERIAIKTWLGSIIAMVLVGFKVCVLWSVK